MVSACVRNATPWILIFANSALLMFHLMYPGTSLLLLICFIWLVHSLRVGWDSKVVKTFTTFL